ncbi:MAG: M28 family peptidase [Ignavibacteriales bacterium]|nr:M28 family peptidase [Ignavibacteriales bacterium]
MKAISGILILLLVLFFNSYSQKSTDKTKTDRIVFQKDRNEVNISSDPFIQNLINQISKSNLVNEITKLQSFKTRHSLSDSIQSAKNYLIQQLVSYGYSPVTFEFNYSGRILSNVIATIQGISNPEKIIVIGGHYDSTSPDISNSPGADDNGTGVSTILEAARIFKYYQFGYTIKFIFFAAEEQGLIGSERWVQNYVVPKNLNIILMMNLDMIGSDKAFNNKSIYCERDEDNIPSSNNVTSAAYTDTLASFITNYTNLTPEISFAWGSDYISFADAGYIITGMFERNMSSHYHKRTDLLEFIDTAYYFQTSKGAIAAMAYFSRVIKDTLVVPVELTSCSFFEVDNGVLIEWETASQLNVARFVIEKENCLTNEKFVVKEIIADGTTNISKNYFYTDIKTQPGTTYIYRLIEIDFDGTEKMLAEKKIKITHQPEYLLLAQNYPNPFNPSTKIKYSLKSSGYVKLSLFNCLGKFIVNLVDELKPTGEYEVEFNNNQTLALSSGIYIYRISYRTENGQAFNAVKTMVLFK